MQLPDDPAEDPACCFPALLAAVVLTINRGMQLHVQLPTMCRRCAHLWCCCDLCGQCELVQLCLACRLNGCVVHLIITPPA